MTVDNWVLVIVALVTLVILWTTTVVGCLVWLNNRFIAITAQIESRLPLSTYESRHQDLAERVRQLELWRAARNGVS